MLLLQALLTIFAIIGLGVACEKKGLFSSTHIEAFEIFLFKIGMPCYLFAATLHYDLAVLIHTNYIFSYLASFLIIAIMVVGFLDEAMRKFHRKEYASKICIRVLASGYVNSAIYALPIISFLLQDPMAGLVGNLVQVVLIQPLIITFLSLASHEEKSMARRLLTPLFTPLVAMPVLGLLFNYLQIIPHPVIINIAESIGAGASGIALFTFGLNLGHTNFTRKSMSKELLLLVGLKNVMHPIIAFCVGKYIFNLAEYWLYSLVISASAPTGFVVYLIAKQFSIDQNQVRIIIAATSLASLVSLICIVLSIGH